MLKTLIVDSGLSISQLKALIVVSVLSIVWLAFLSIELLLPKRKKENNGKQ
jgi:hypothetical protein